VRGPIGDTPRGCREGGLFVVSSSRLPRVVGQGFLPSRGGFVWGGLLCFPAGSSGVVDMSPGGSALPAGCFFPSFSSWDVPSLLLPVGLGVTSLVVQVIQPGVPFGASGVSTSLLVLGG